METKIVAKRLTYKNNWENDIYYVDGKPIKELYTVLIAGKNYVVTAKAVSISYDDMGHTYTSRSTHYFIQEAVFGVLTTFDLNTMMGKVKVFAIGYKSE